MSETFLKVTWKNVTILPMKEAIEFITKLQKDGKTVDFSIA